ncbi:uncharacterized protein LOC111056792 [Nilaparvata lugens]|uniref:uncharacterized protein LOC111056792 n=1 Tax=Nilaparvata lugens TaxID=108931 RepID=UPI00193D5A1F|nr:uncharacterized protein LOC111056792 [Nilaparvata lugens]
MSVDNRAKWKCIVCKTGSVGSSDSAALSVQALSTAGNADNKQSLSVLDIQAIGRVVKEIISSELSPTFKEDFQSVKHSIEFMSNEFDSFKNDLLKHKEEVNKLNKEVMTLKQENEKLKSEVAEMQGYTRKDSVVVTGIPETKSESVFELFNKLSSVIKSPVVSNGLSTAHRLPSRGKEQIKPIVFKFVRRQDKEDWLADFKQAASEDNGGAGISSLEPNKKPVQCSKVAAPPLNLTCAALVTRPGDLRLTGELQTASDRTGKTDKQNGLPKKKRFGITETLIFATWNVRGVNKKEGELMKELKHRKVNVAVITETKKKLKGTKDWGDYVEVWSGVEQNRRACAGVMVLVDRKWKNRIESYAFVDERAIRIRFKVDRGFLTLIGVYAPEEGRKAETIEFYDILQRQLKSCKKSDYVIVAGDLNARVGNHPIPQVVGTFGECHLNENGRHLRDFCTFNDLKITNTFFKKKDIHKYTWAARGYRSLIDYVIVNKKMSSQVQDTRVYRGSDISSDHYLVASKIQMWTKWRKRKKLTQKEENEAYKVYLLQTESVRNLYQTRLTQKLSMRPTASSVEEEWNIVRDTLKDVAYETLGTQKLKKRKKGLKIWNEEISEAIRNKKKAYKQLLQSPTDQAKQNYRIKRNIAKTIVRKAHEDSWDRFISGIEDDLHGRQEVAYKLIKHLNSDVKEMAKIENIGKEEWIQHYKDLWYKSDVPFMEKAQQLQRKIDGIDLIGIEELEEALRQTKNRKATGLDHINSELLKYGGTLLKFRLLHLINMCWTSR